MFLATRVLKSDMLDPLLLISSQINFHHTSILDVILDPHFQVPTSSPPSGIEWFLGTMFRFPLRTTQTANDSQIKRTTYSPDEVHQLLESFQHQASDVILFLKNVNKISVVQSNENGEKQVLFSVERKVQDLDQFSLIPKCVHFPFHAGLFQYQSSSPIRSTLRLPLISQILTLFRPVFF